MFFAIWVRVNAPLMPDVALVELPLKNTNDECDENVKLLLKDTLPEERILVQQEDVASLLVDGVCSGQTGQTAANYNDLVLERRHGGGMGGRE